MPALPSWLFIPFVVSMTLDPCFGSSTGTSSSSSGGGSGSSSSSGGTLGSSSSGSTSSSGSSGGSGSGSGGTSSGQEGGVMLDSGGGSGSGSSSGSSSGGSSEGGAVACSITLSGSVTGTFACSVTTVYATGSNLGGPTLTVLNPSPLEALAVTITDPGTCMSGTWSSTDPGAKGTLFVSSSGLPPPSWQATVGSSASNDEGSYTMNITVVSSTPVSNGDDYVAHGTINGTLLPVAQTGSTGSVTLNATF